MGARRLYKTLLVCLPYDGRCGFAEATPLVSEQKGLRDAGTYIEKLRRVSEPTLVFPHSQPKP